MNKTFKITTFIVATLAIAIGIYAWLEFNRGHVSLEKEVADFVLSAEELYTAFEQDEAAADQKYSGKIIEIEGIVGQIENPTASVVNVLLKAGESQIGGILCSFDKMEPVQLATIQPGGKLKVRGSCSGFLMDVSLLRCVLISH